VVGKLVSALDEVRAEAIASYKAKVDADALVKELTAVQVDSLGIDYCQKYAGSQQERVAYMEGVAAVEDLITARIKKLKAGK
jgi:hypothetical protein